MRAFLPEIRCTHAFNPALSSKRGKYVCPLNEFHIMDASHVLRCLCRSHTPHLLTVAHCLFCRGEQCHWFHLGLCVHICLLHWPQRGIILVSIISAQRLWNIKSMHIRPCSFQTLCIFFIQAHEYFINQNQYHETEVIIMVGMFFICQRIQCGEVLLV